LTWTGRPSIPPEKLLRAWLLQMLYSIRSERLLMEEIDYSILFRWFVGMNLDDTVLFKHSPKGTLKEVEFLGRLDAAIGDLDRYVFGHVKFFSGRLDETRRGRLPIDPERARRRPSEVTRPFNRYALWWIDPHGERIWENVNDIESGLVMISRAYKPVHRTPN
jgi:hypothetical protein